MKIVIVDDDIFVSGALTTILEASGKVTVCLLYTSPSPRD